MQSWAHRAGAPSCSAGMRRRSVPRANESSDAARISQEPRGSGQGVSTCGCERFYPAASCSESIGRTNPAFSDSHPTAAALRQRSELVSIVHHLGGTMAPRVPLNDSVPSAPPSASIWSGFVFDPRPDASPGRDTETVNDCERASASPATLSLLRCREAAQALHGAGTTDRRDRHLFSDVGKSGPAERL